jgi:hypothetical protein
MVSRDEMGRLRAWLEVDRGIDFPACAFLHETIETISDDGEITEAELGRLGLAIERVLPKEVRASASEKRRRLREQRRQEQTVQRAAARAQQKAARQRARPVHRGDYHVAGAFMFQHRRDSCERLNVGDAVLLEREPENRQDRNAILVLSENGDELGYVPRQHAREMAPLLDGGAVYEATVKRLWQTDDGNTVPFIVSVLHYKDSVASTTTPASRRTNTALNGTAPDAMRGCLWVLLLVAVGVTILVVLSLILVS